MAEQDERLARLKREAEAEMSRSAPPLSKKHKTDCSQSGDAEEKTRYSYAAVDALVKGCACCFLATCNFRREKSATFELTDILRKVLPGVQLQLVRVDCNGLVVVAASQPETAPETAPEGPAQGAQQQQQQQQQRPLQPTAVVQDILQRMEAGSLPRTKFIQRIIPAETTCLLTAAALRPAVEQVVRRYMAQQCSSSSSSSSAGGDGSDGNGQTQHAPLTFAVMFKSRGSNAGSGGNNQQQQQQQEAGLVGDHIQAAAEAGEAAAAAAAEAPLDRKLVTDIAAAVVQECCRDLGGAKADLASPQVALVLEVIPVARQQLACSVAAVPGALMVTKPRLNMKPTGAAGKQ